ncbi:MAG: hypothetical protein HY361_04955 [Candidatus Aenigmarchaeota archaeon]|nr:hypothetical protein [Candidatus Aenigmarchaeota archaeon]
MSLSERYINPFLRDVSRGVKDLHCYVERKGELVNGPQAIGYLAAFFGYTFGSANLVGKYGPEGFLILTIPAITNLMSFYKQHAQEWRLRRLEMDWEIMGKEGERRTWVEDWDEGKRKTYLKALLNIQNNTCHPTVFGFLNFKIMH